MPETFCRFCASGLPNSLRSAPFVIGFFAGCFYGTVAAAACPALPSPMIEVIVRSGAVSVVAADTSADMGTLMSDDGVLQPDEVGRMLLGLHTMELQLLREAEARGVGRPDGSFCVGYTRIRAELVISQPTIRIAREVQSDSACLASVIAHEEMHHRIAIDHVRNLRNRFHSALDAFTRGLVVAAPNFEDGSAKLGAMLSEFTSQRHAEYTHELRARQDRLDSRETYAAVSAICRGAIAASRDRAAQR